MPESSIGLVGAIKLEELDVNRRKSLDAQDKKIIAALSLSRIGIIRKIPELANHVAIAAAVRHEIIETWKFNNYYFHKLSVVMSPRDLIFCVLLILFVRFSSTSIIWPQRLVVRLSEPVRSLEAIPDRWRMMHPEFKAPQIEIKLMKSLVSPDEKWMFANKYKYSGKDYEYVCKR